MIEMYGHAETEYVHLMAKIFFLSFQAPLPGNNLNTRENLIPHLLHRVDSHLAKISF